MKLEVIVALSCLVSLKVVKSDNLEEWKFSGSSVNNQSPKKLSNALSKRQNTGSCEGYCGGQAPSGCFCHVYCLTYSHITCCNDFRSRCPDTCVGHCYSPSTAPSGCSCGDCDNPHIAPCCDDAHTACPDSCPALGIANGNINYNRESSYGLRHYDRIITPFRYPFGTVATFTCNYGYSLKGSGTRTCQNSTNWNPSQPTCQLIRCEDINILNGWVTYQVGPLPVDRGATFRCYSNYYLDGPSSTQCSESGQWDPPPSTCEPITCGRIHEGLVNGRFTYSRQPLANGRYTVGTFISYECNTGYRQTGTFSRGCGSDSNWSPNDPPATCVLVYCEVLSLQNGRVTYSRGKQNGKYPANTVATFRCNSGYDLRGIGTSTCRYIPGNGGVNRHGTWNPNPPSCQKKPTPPPPKRNGCFPSHSQVRLENGKTMKMSELQIGDIVQTVSSSGSVTYSKITAFLKKQPKIITEYMLIVTVNETLTLTGNHLLYASKRSDLQYRPIYADQLFVGDEVLIERNNELASVNVINVSSLTVQGAYVPLTMEGKIIVDGVLTSCYADFDHDFAHLIMISLQRFTDFMNCIFGDDNGFPVFVSTTRELGILLLPDALFWNY